MPDPICSVCGRTRQGHGPHIERSEGADHEFVVRPPPRPRTVGELVALLSEYPPEAEVTPDGMAGDVVLVSVSRSWADDQESTAAPTGPVVLEVVPADGWVAYSRSLAARDRSLAVWTAEPCWCNGPWDRTRTHGPSACPRRKS